MSWKRRIPKELFYLFQIRQRGSVITGSLVKGYSKRDKKEIDSKDWDKIVTHNPDGEYGHIHHKKGI